MQQSDEERRLLQWSLTAPEALCSREFGGDCMWIEFHENANRKGGASVFDLSGTH